MSRSLRAQVSLIFSDEDIFDNFVTPLKENKELSGMIVKLLTAYYNSEDVRNSVEGVSFEDLEGADQVIDSTEAINQMRQTLAMQDFLFEQAKQTLEDGASEMDALRRVNDMAKQSGVVKTEHTESGEALVQLSLENSTLRSEEKQEPKTSDNSNLESRVGKIEEALTNIMNMLQNGAFNQTTTSIKEEPVVNKVEDEQKTSISNEESQVLTTEVHEEEVSEPIIEEPASTIPEPENIIEDDSNLETSEEDASSELGDVLKDLLG